MTRPRGPRPLVAGNWKMNGTSASLGQARTMAAMLKRAKLRCEVMLCPPATLIAIMARALKASRIRFGGQDCHAQSSGAHTGDISAEMLVDAGACAVIVGHSERRRDHKESNDAVRAKAAAAHRAGLTAIVCIGETLDQRQAGQTLEVVDAQIAGSLPAGATSANTVIAYEPVWAIGTGLTPTHEQVGEVHARIRARLKAAGGEDGNDFRILYGGSVKPGNAAELMAVPNVNGALVGGASLKVEDFVAIVMVYGSGTFAITGEKRYRPAPSP